MAFKRKFDSELPDSNLQVLENLDNIPLQNLVLNEVESETSPANDLWLERKLSLQYDRCAKVFHEMLIKSLRADAVETNISETHGLQEWLCSIDILTKSWPILMQAMKNTNYLKGSRARSFLAFGMTLDRKLTEDLHKACKSYLPFCTEVEAKSYGLIYLEAWQFSSAAMREVIAEQCIYDLMDCVLTLPRTGMKMSPFGKNIITVLHSFHSQRSCNNICEMLSSMYDKCLWNALKDPNTHVRCNAVEVLIAAYPLEKPNLTVMENNNYLEKQHDVMSDVLKDVNSSVRGVAVREICSLMTRFWAYIRPSIIQHWIYTMILQLKYSREPESRKNLYQGLHTLVMNPNQSYTMFLEKMLPELLDHINDKDQSVRLAFVELLLEIKNKGDIKFWNIAPLQLLITRLQEDESEVCELLVQLLYSAYFPRSRRSQAVLNCIKNMIHISHQGTRKFFLHSESVIKFDSAIKLILEIMGHLLKHIQEYYFKRKLINDFNQPRGSYISHKKWRKTISHRRVSQHEKKVWMNAVRSTRNIEEPVSSSESSDDDSQSFSFADSTCSNDSEEEEVAEIYQNGKYRNPQMYQGFLDVVNILFYVHSATRKEKTLRKQWLKVYRICKQCIPIFALYLAGSCAFESLFVLSSMVPVKLLKTIRLTPDMEALWQQKLHLLSCGDDSEEVIHLASFIWLKNSGKAFFMTAANIFSTAITSRMVNATTSLKKPDKQLLKYESDTLLKFKILRAAFTNFPYRTRIVAQNSKYMLDTWRAMEQIKRLIEIRLENVMCFKDPVAADRFIAECFSCYVRLIPVLKFSSMNEFNNMDECLKLLDWANNVLLLRVPEKCPYENERGYFEWNMIDTTGNLTVSLLNSLLGILPNMMEMEHKTNLFLYKAVRLCKRVLRTGCRLLFISSCVKLLSKICTYCKNTYTGNSLQKTFHVTVYLLKDCISGFSDGIPSKNFLKPSIQDYANVEDAIKTTFLTSVNLYGTSSMKIIDVVHKFIDVILTTMAKGDFMLTDAELRDVHDLPFIACRFVSIFVNSDCLSEIFLETFMQVVNNTNIELQQLIASAKLIHILVYCPGVLQIESLTAAVRNIKLAVRGYTDRLDSIPLREFNMNLQPTLNRLFRSMEQHLGVT